MELLVESTGDGFFLLLATTSFMVDPTTKLGVLGTLWNTVEPPLTDTSQYWTPPNSGQSKLSRLKGY